MPPLHIIGIHGLGNKPAAPILEARWLAAIREGLERNESGHFLHAFTFELVYWADLRVPTRAPESEDSKANAYTRFNGPGKLPEYKESWLDVVRATVRATAGGLADFIGDNFHRNVVSDDLLRKLEDLDFYYKDENFRNALRGRLGNRLQAHKGKRIALVSHSMGTVVAMDVLRHAEQAGSPIPLNFLITMGSPLGLPYIVWRQTEEFRVARTPEAVGHWTNFSERRDKVCFDLHLSNDYSPNESGCKVVDDLIFNTVASDPHQAFGYLRAPEFSRLLAKIAEF